MISVENLTKNFGNRLLLDEVSLKINSRERVGLVGRNGHGKTTLFRILIGEEPYDKGSIIIPKYYRISYVRQIIDFTQDTVLKEGMTGLMEGELDHFWKVEKILAGLGFSNKDMQRDPRDFSGGYQVRLNLAKALVSEPNLLLLDEPTNYLDITSIRWIERFLLNWPNELLLITHDRSFMDKIVTHTIGIHRKKTRKILGNTGKLYAQIAQVEEIYEKTRLKDERRRKDVEQFINRFRAKARLANLVQSRIKSLDKMQKRDKLEKIQTLDFSFRDNPFSGKSVLSARDVYFSYNSDIPLIKNFNITIKPRDRVCIIGKNGKGKTTLLKLLAGTLNPQKGEIITTPNVIKGLFEQTNIKSLIDKRTVEEELLYSHSDVDRQMARDICGAMMFKGDDALKRINVLSGGEKSRVMLGKLLVTPVNLLLLDEPTNHLDMESCDALLSAIDNFDGAVIIVTHNEMFLHALSERLIVFQNNRIYVFEGNYQNFLDNNGWEEEKISIISTNKDDALDNEYNTKISKKDIRRHRSQIITDRSSVLKPLKAQIDQIEAEIEAKEEELEENNRFMIEASASQDGERISELSQSIHNCKSVIDSLFDELEELTNNFNEQSALFEKRLNHLEHIKDF
ncbi:MAG: ABC-F family ATP-binding cassette domain-containing protein [Spirochaetota bacterium]|nr:ABC-F family ATP-binding cassette domain-containing protein [Spirochaetota bacterium]